MRFFDAQVKLDERISGLFSALANHAIRQPRRIVAVAIAITLIVAPGILRLKLRTDGHALVSETSPEVMYDRTIRAQFGIQDLVIVLIRSGHPDGIFNPDTLQLVRELTADFAGTPAIGSSNVMSLATELNFRFRPGTYINQRLLEPALTNKMELDQLRDDLRRIELYTGTLVSRDGQSTVILVGIPNGADRSQLCGTIRRIIAARNAQPDAIGITGAPVAESLLGVQILEDLGVPKALLGASVQADSDKPAGGWPAGLHEVRLLVARHVGLVPVAALVMLVVVFLCFRNWIGVLVPLPGVVATMIFVFGLMGWLGVPIYLTTAVMPVLLTVISVTNDIYLFNRYFSLLRERPGANQIELVQESFDRLVRPVACTSLTAVISFLSFAFSPLAPVRAFGIFTGVGALFGLFLSFTVVPALLVLINPSQLLRRGRGEGKAAVSAMAAWFARLGQVVVRRRWWVAGIALGIAALTPLGLRRLVVQDSWTNGFDPESEFRRVTRQVNEDFFGMHQLFVSFDASNAIAGEVGTSNVHAGSIILPSNVVENPTLIEGAPIVFSVCDKSQGNPPGGQIVTEWQSQIRSPYLRGANVVARIAQSESPTNFWVQALRIGRIRFKIAVQSHFDPGVMRTVADLASFIRQKQQYAVGGVLSPAEYLLTTRFMLRPSDQQARRMPDTAAEVKKLWNYYRVALGSQRLRQVVDTNYWQSLTTVFLKDGNFVDTARLMEDIRAYEREHLAPKGIKLGFAGDVAVSQSLIHGIVTTQMQSLIWSLAGIFVVTAVMGGSLRWGFYCLLPSVLAVLIKFAVMGWSDIPLGVATSMFAAMTLGIGVNCAIHLLEGCGQSRAAGASPTEALSRSLRLTGPPALINTLAVSLGFGVLMLSQVPANARLGLLLVLGLVNCFIVSLVLLPVLLYWWPLKDARQP